MRIEEAQQSGGLVHASILHGFGDVRGLQVFAVCQIGDGAGHLEDAMVGARGEIQTGDGQS